MQQSRKIRSNRKCSREIQITIKSSTHKEEKLLPNYARRKNSYGWKKSGIIEETREEKHERMFFKVV
jgi:hypothetical protein